VAAAQCRGMKASKLIVFIGGVLGIIAFFLPLITVTSHGHKGSASALQIFKGASEVSDAVDSDHDVRASLSHQEMSAAKDGASAVKGIVMAVFFPAVLLAILGGAGMMRRKFGRVAGTFSLIFGLIGLAIAGLLVAASEGGTGSGAILLVVTGIAGFLGGLLALIKPDRGAVAGSSYPAAAVAPGYAR